MCMYIIFFLIFSPAAVIAKKYRNLIRGNAFFLSVKQVTICPIGTLSPATV